MRRARPRLLIVLTASMLPFAVACGKKGPPLAPLRPAPAAVADIAATRLGEVVQLQVPLPATNADRTAPADLAHVDIYAVTGKPEGPLGRALTVREIETLLTRVQRIEVQPPPPPDAEEADQPATPAVPATAAPADPRPAQGATVRVEETLTDAMRTSVFTHPDAEKVARVRAAAGDEIDEAPVPSTDGTGRPLLWPQPATITARQYIAIPYSTRNRAGAPSAPLAVSLEPAPAAPAAPAVTHDASAFTITWAPPPGTQLPVQATVTPAAYKEAISAKQLDTLLPAKPVVNYGTPHTYRVYEVPAPGATVTAPALINTAPIETPSFVDPRMAFGVPRCYAVRTVQSRGAVTIESALSPPTCVTAVDTYPPPAPTGLVAVGSEGG
ncbi:MAG TPA: hypothetical protein VMF13_15980, partial [Luteitalea sp.]|nr:hypothetical protein [Luteitalea sp.]